MNLAYSLYNEIMKNNHRLHLKITIFLKITQILKVLNKFQAEKNEFE